MVDKPWLELKGHSGDVLDLAWNRRGCIASSSTDKTVRVWHLSQPVAPLAVFAHADFVPSVAFHPTDDWLFTTGCFDGKVRVWSLEDKKLVGSADLAPQYVTSVQFAHDGQWVVAGTYGGHLVVYALDEHGALTVRGQVAIKNGPGGRTGRAVLPMTKDGNLSSGGMTAAAATLAASSTTTATTSTSSTASSRPRKITGIEVWPDPTGAKELLIVSSNDSRIRIVDATDLKVVAKLKGHANKHAQIHGTVAESAIGPRWVFSGSEDGRLYVWDTVLVPSLAPPAMEPPVPGAADGDAADGEGPRSLPPAQQQSKTNTRNRSVSLSTSSRLGRLKHSLFSTSGHDTHRGAALESTSPTTGSFPPTTTVGSPLASVPAATVTLADHEAADVSRCTVTCVASAPLKTRLFLESAGLLPTRWVPPDTVLSSSTTATTPTSAVPTPTLPEPIRNPAEWILTAAADQAGVIRLYINLPAHITLPSPASTLPRSRSIGQEIASAIRRSLSSLTITATTKSGAGDDGQPGPATASTGLRGATSSADLVPVADAPPPVPPLPVLGSGSVGRRAGRRGMVDDPPPPQDASPPDVTATTAVAEGCPYCGSTAFRDLQVIASSESLPNNADESMSPAEGRIVVCCQCLRVVNDSSRVLGQ
ncbi:WD40-repeat-containing domain protein [Blastocladiella britannica]|nr:WD40-repeat-containing domain protein [Blastocladiella britannica]